MSKGHRHFFSLYLIFNSQHLLIIAVSSFIYSKYIHGIFAICQELCTWYALVKIVWKKEILVERKESSLKYTVRVLLFFFFLTASCFVLFWLHWVLIALHRLSLVVVRGDYSSLQCSGFSLGWLLLLWSTGSRRMGFSLCDMQALERGLNSCGAQA